MAKTSAESSSPSIPIIDRFLAEGSINWILAIGGILLFGSSLMLVTSHWEVLSDFTRGVVLLGYCGAFSLAGEWCWSKWGLRKTASALLGTVLLATPVLFIGLSRMGAASWILIPFDLAFAYWVSRRLLSRFLHGAPPTLWMSYLLLALAGWWLPKVGETGTPFAMLGLFAIYAVGGIKGARHVFWLTEEKRRPRALGYLPMIVLTVQYVVLAVLHGIPSMTPSWCGFFLTLMAIPILSNGWANLHVAQARMGLEPQRWPITVGVSIGLGMAFSLGGLLLSASGLMSGLPPKEFVPSAAVVSFLLVTMARKTDRRAFVWMALIVATLTYNFSPAWFLDLARRVISTGTELVGESRMPIAFYGLTYLPLILAGTWLGGVLHRRGEKLFASALRVYIPFLSTLLVVFSMTHVKAAFPVPLLMCVGFVLQASRFQFDRLHYLAAASWSLSAVFLGPFLNSVWDVNVGGPWLIWGPAVASLTISLARLLRRDRHVESWAQVGEVHAAFAAVVWLVQVILVGFDLSAAVWVTCAQLGHGLAHRRTRGVYAAVLFGLLAGGVAVAQGILSPAIYLGALALLKLGGASLRPKGALRAACRRALYWAPTLFVGVAAIVFLPRMLGVSLGFVGSPPSALLVGLVFVGLLPLRGSRRTFGLPAIFGILLPATLLANWMPRNWSPLLPVVTAMSSLVVTRWSAFRGDPVAEWIGRVSGWTLAIASLALPGWGWRLAGALAVVASRGRGDVQGRAWRTLIPWQIVALYGTLADPRMQWGSVGFDSLGSIVLLAGLGAVVSLALCRRTSWFEGPGAPIHRALLKLTALGLWVGGFLLADGVGWGLVATSIVIGLAIDEGTLARRKQEASHVGRMFVAVGLGAITLFGYEVLSIESGLGAWLALVLGIVSWALSSFCHSRNTWALFANPLRGLAYALPSISCLLALIGLEGGHQMLAMLFCAGFFFWRGIEGRKRWPLLVALAVTNVSMILRFAGLGWVDPEVYLMPLGASVLVLSHALRRDLNEKLLGFLRYGGAALILMSPLPSILGGSLASILLHMVSSVATVFLSIALRVRALLYAGSLFTVLSVGMMVVRGSFEHPSVLWISGSVLGLTVLGCGAVFESRRERALARIRHLTYVLKQWH